MTNNFDSEQEIKKPIASDEFAKQSNDATGETIADTQNEVSAKKSNFKRILLIAGVLLFVLIFFGFCITRRAPKKTEVVLPPSTVQTSNTTGQLVDNLTATPTPAMPGDANSAVPVNPAMMTNPNANVASMNDPRYVANSGLYQPNVPVTQQTQAFQEQQKQAMIERGNNPKSVQQNGSARGGGNGVGVGGNYSSVAYSGGNGDSNSIPINDSAIAKVLGVDDSSENLKRSKAVFYGNATNPSKAVQLNQMTGILAAKNLNFNNIPFGTLLPVRTIGAVHTLLPSALARMELTQPVKGDGWLLPAGTIIVGQVSQGIGNRVNITPRGFILNDQFFQLQGEISGTDGGIGLLGDRKSVGGKWYRSLIEVADKVQQSFNAWLSGRGGGNITSVQYPSVSQIADVNTSKVVNYIAVKPNATGYLLVTQLPSQNAGGVLNNVPPTIGAIPSSIPGLSVEDINTVFSSGNEKAIEAIINRKP